MSYQLGEYVVYGEFRNTGHYSTDGMIALRGSDPDKETIVHVTLTGNCADDLRGRHFRFWPREEDENPDRVFRKVEHQGFQLRQIGPTGTMTASGWARVMPCSVEEFMRRAHLGEPPPTEWKRRLYLEWFSQNGRVVVELADPLVEECVREPRDKDDEADWAPLPNAAPRPSAELPPSQGPEFTLIRKDGDGFSIEHLRPAEERCDDDEEEHGLIPGSLQQSFDAEAAAVDRAIRGEDSEDDDADEAMRELELLDYLIENKDGEPVLSLMGDRPAMPPEESLDDEAVEAALKLVLADLAVLNVVVDVCEHCTPRDCYRVLVKEMLPEMMVYKELIGTREIQHVGTYDYCLDCEAEFDEYATDAGEAEATG